MPSASRVGFFTASGLFLIGIVYAAAVGAGISEAGLSRPITDPILAVMEVLTLLSAILFLVLMAALRESAPHERRVFGTAALVFAAVMAGLTCAVHFVALTAGRQSGLTVLEWPSVSYAVELLAWDVFLGLSLLSAAFVFDGGGLRAIIRGALALSGILALMGTIGPIVGNMAWQRIGILGYGIGLPLVALMLAIFFRRLERL